MDRDYYSDSMMMVKPSRKTSNAGGGKSAYEIWLDEGHTGSEADFLKSLQGEGFDPSACTLSLHTDGLLYMFYHGQPMGNGVALPSGSSGDVVGNVDSENNIIVQGKFPDGTYTVKYEMEDGTTVDIGDLVLDSNTYYSVTKNLTNCTVSNSATQVVAGGSYSATISANSGYTLDSVSVTMGGSAVSVSGGVINIASVTGDIVITAVAREAVVEPSYTNLVPTLTDIDLVTIYNGKGYKENTRVSVSGVSASNPGGYVTSDATLTGLMPLGNDGDVLHLRGAQFYADTGNYDGLIWYYDVNGTLLNTGTIAITTMNLTGTDANGDATFTLTHSKMSIISGTAYIRFNITNPTGELIMTRNQLIPV